MTKNKSNRESLTPPQEKELRRRLIQEGKDPDKAKKLQSLNDTEERGESDNILND